MTGAVAGATWLSSVSKTQAAPAAERAVRNGRIKQSIVQWCFADHWDTEQLAGVAKKLGCLSIELCPPSDFPILKRHGLDCAIAGIDLSPDPPFVKGHNNPKYWPRVQQATREAIDKCVEFGFRRVIAFTGMAEDISPEDGIKNCAASLKQVAAHAEKNKVTLCLEMLNTRDDTHPMKGHPGYQGNHLEYCVEILRQVGSSHVKLLFDIYHAQIMDGDIIRRLREYKDYLGHIHTAGNPGRIELDDRQEINYPAVMQALLDLGYEGYVGQEFIPTRDPLVGLQQAVSLCDV